MIKHFTALAGALLLVFSVSAAQLDQDTQQFLQKAYSSNLAEVELGKLAAQKATRPEFKQLGQQLADEHLKLADSIKKLSDQWNYKLSSDIPMEKQNEIAQLEKLSGPQFDQAFINLTLEHHQDSVALFQKQAQTGTNEQVKTFASNNLPALQAHLQTTRNLQQQLAGPTPAGVPLEKSYDH